MSDKVRRFPSKWEWVGTMVCAMAILGLFAFRWCIEPREVVVVEERVQEVVVDREVEVYVVTATVYHAIEGQCDDSPLVTASGAKISSAESAYDHRYLTYDLLLESNCWWSKYEGYTLSLHKSHIQDILENAISEMNQMLSQLEVTE